jgi:hypothetical protein
VWAYDRKNIRRHSSNCRELNFLKFDGGLPVLDPVPHDGDHGGPQVARGGASRKANMEEIRCRYPKRIAEEHCLYVLYSERGDVGWSSSSVGTSATHRGATRSSFTSVVDLTGDSDSSLERWSLV